MKLFVCLLLLGTAFGVRAAEPIPEKTVVLTFDDAVESHLSVVAPILKEHGFGGTFFISHAWMNDTENFMTWEQVGALYAMGFEIGNHTWTHAGQNTPRAASRFAGELALVENALRSVGVPKPISFAWTGNAFSPESRAILEENGYLLARRGMQPEAPYGQRELGPLFNPNLHHALLIPSAGDGYPNWDLAHFKTVVDRTGNGKIAVVQFHGVPDVAHPWVHTPEDKFREYMAYLKDNGFNVIALRDVLPYLPEEPLDSDFMQRVRYPAGSSEELYWPTEVSQSRERLNYWLDVMTQHGYTLAEMQQVTALPKKTLEARLAKLSPAPAKDDVINVLPYPGGRHPRIGFLEAAIDPIRGTKVSIFTPWEDGGYVVLDLPEAIFSNLGLTYLAHTHIPSIWDDANRYIENRDWIPEDDGGLRGEWTLPNKISFGARVVPQADEVDFELWLKNDSDADLSKLRTQVCLMLKAAPGFNAQDKERKHYDGPVVSIQAEGKDRWMLLAFEQCKRAWDNPKCPCMHSDPTLPDAPAGERVSVQGKLRFHEGPGVEEAIAKLRAEMLAGNE
jgi:peptidoglycan/xylan/chitin deacetylase (PgdA/CDA1 family)